MPRVATRTDPWLARNRERYAVLRNHDVASKEARNASKSGPLFEAALRAAGIADPAAHYPELCKRLQGGHPRSENPSSYELARQARYWRLRKAGYSSVMANEFSSGEIATAVALRKKGAEP